MTEVDRTVIERCWITPGEFGGTKVLYDEADANAWRKAGFEVTGPWVLEAQQPQGAVETLRRITGDAGPPYPDWYFAGRAEDREQAMKTEARRALGGAVRP
jgi:hypothetical protein